MPATSVLPNSENHLFVSGWKEIASYLDRGVRTVQRWEKDLAFPVRRPRGRSRSAVIALRSDIDIWLQSMPTNKTGIAVSHRGDDQTLQPEPTGVVQESRLLRASVTHSRYELREAVIRLTRSIERQRKELDLSSL